MSLTDAQTVFASVHEDAINDMLVAFCTARPRYLSYGSPAFTPVTTAAETQMAAIAFPGTPGGIQWRQRPRGEPHSDRVAVDDVDDATLEQCRPRVLSPAGRRAQRQSRQQLKRPPP